MRTPHFQLDGKDWVADFTKLKLKYSAKRRMDIKIRKRVSMLLQIEIGFCKGNCLYAEIRLMNTFY